MIGRLPVQSAQIWLPLPNDGSPLPSPLKLEIVQQVNLKEQDTILSYPNEMSMHIHNIEYGFLKCSLNCLECQNSFSCLKCVKGMVWRPNELECKLPYVELLEVINLGNFVRVFGRSNKISMMILKQFGF